MCHVDLQNCRLRQKNRIQKAATTLLCGTIRKRDFAFVDTEASFHPHAHTLNKCSIRSPLVDACTLAQDCLEYKIVI